jgi:hypothetical protein
MNANKKSGDPVQHYILAEITGKTESQKILDITRDKIQGLCSIHAGNLEAGQNVAVERVVLKAASHATEVNPLAISGYSSVTEDWDPALTHGRLEIKQGGKVVFGYECEGLGTAAKSEGNTGMFDGFELEQPFVLVEGKPVTAEIIYANGLTVDATAKHHVKLLLIGTETSPK